MTDFRTLLTDINHEQLADPEIATVTPDHKIAAGWLGESGATEAEIALAEQRIGVRLPPSYRTFLTESNGFYDIGPFIYRLYSAAEIDWFRVRNQDWIDAYQIGDDISPEEHLANPKDCVRFRTAYLSSCLQISEEGDSAVVLLNPEVVNDEGEWEAWFFANWNPGATRYPSFRAYVESELESIRFIRASKRL
jgi:cell wall assembly regulator SMI1